MIRIGFSAGKVALLAAAASLSVQAQTPEYHIYAGSTHAHTMYTWSHGDQFAKGDCAGIVVYSEKPTGFFGWSDGYVKREGKCPAIFVILGSQLPSPDMVVRPDWEKHQGPPAEHYKLAKAAGYDFYTVSDHSQEAVFQQPSAENPAWLTVKRQAAEATDTGFVALAAYEHSENDGPGGMGHINVINSSGMINALAPGVDLPYFYKWLKTAAANGQGPVVATFNHPGKDQYGDWANRDPQVTDIITMLEVINSNNKIHYEAFVRALDKGWKVSPVCGNDNHGTIAIGRQTSRTFVLAAAKTKAAILDAMKNRRTYASLDGNLQCRYTVNGAVMGSMLKSPSTFRFAITVSDADTSDPKSKITKIDIVKDGGAVAQEYTPAPAYSVEWNPTITDSASQYFFVRVWTAGGGDAPGADPAKPVAWLAPVWTGR